MSKSNGPCPTALVTGGRRGIGRSICVELARRGFDVVLTDVTDDEDAQATCELIRNEGQDALFVRSDLSDIESHAEVLNAAIGFKGSVECLVNNAGVGSPSRGDLLDVRSDAFDTVLGINLRGTFFMTQAVARHMIATPSKRRALDRDCLFRLGADGFDRASGVLPVEIRFADAYAAFRVATGEVEHRRLRSTARNHPHADDGRRRTEVRGPIRGRARPRGSLG